MSTATFVCPLCAHQFAPLGNQGCASCPLQRGCSMVCCPACGYSTVNPEQSRAARMVARLLTRKESHAELQATKRG